MSLGSFHTEQELDAFVSEVVSDCTNSAGLTRNLGGVPVESNEIALMKKKNPAQYMKMLFTAMRLAYCESRYTTLTKPHKDVFERQSMKNCIRTIKMTQAQKGDVDNVSFHLAVANLYAAEKGTERTFDSDGKCMDLAALKTATVLPAVTRAVATLLTEMTLWFSTLSFKEHDIPKVLEVFETEMCNRPHLFGIFWPKNIFAPFRITVLMRPDFMKKAPKIGLSENDKCKTKKFIRDFPNECAVSICVMDDAAAMSKWLRIHKNWLSEESSHEAGSVVLFALDHVILNNASECIKCFTREVVDELESHVQNFNSSLDFTALVNDSLTLYRQTDRARSFGYYGVFKFERITEKMFRALFTHPLVNRRAIRKPPKNSAVYGLWVSLVLWEKVRTLVRARSFIREILRLAADRECRAEFAADGSASLLGAVAREGREAFAAAGAGSSRIDERTCVVHSADDEFNLMIQKSLDLVQASRLKRLADSSDDDDSSSKAAKQRV